MLKQRIQYSSSLDALIAVSKRLSLHEDQIRMTSEDFFDQYKKGELSDDLIFIDWSNDYQNYLALRQEIEHKLNYAA